MEGLGVLALLWFLLRGGRTTDDKWPRPRPTFPVEPPRRKGGVTPVAKGPVTLQPLPGAGWKPYNPPPRPVVQRAMALLPRLPLGQWMTEPDPTGGGREVAYRAEPHGTKRGVTAYVRSAGA